MSTRVEPREWPQTREDFEQDNPSAYASAELYEKILQAEDAKRVRVNRRVPFPPSLAVARSAWKLDGATVTIARDPARRPYIVYWPALCLSCSDYGVQKGSRGGVTFAHQCVLIPKERYGNPAARDFSEDVYCVRLPNNNYVRIDKKHLLKMYRGVKICDGNKDNIVEVCGKTFARVPPLIFEEKLLRERQHGVVCRKKVFQDAGEVRSDHAVHASAGTA